MVTEKEAAIISAYTGILVGNFNEMHKYIEQLLKRPVFTHELANKNTMDEIHRRSKKDFCSLIVMDGTPAEDHYGKDVKSEWVCSRCGHRNVASNEVCMGAEMGDGRCGKPKPEPKPLAQYLAEYIEQEVSVACMGNQITFDIPSWRELLEQALDAYKSTENENVKIKIEKQ